MERRKIGWPLVLIAVGILFLMKNLGLIDLDIYQLLFSWPMLLIAIGIVQLIDRSYVSGFILLFLGSVFMLPRLDIIHYDAMRVFWPVILIVIGFILLFRRKETFGKHHRTGMPNTPTAIPSDADGFIHINNLFSGSKVVPAEPIFRGAHLSCTFGGIDLDLRNARLASSEVFIDIDCTFSGITLRLPSAWRIDSRVNATFGGIEDKRPYPPGGTAPDHVVIIRGSATFSGVELR